MSIDSMEALEYAMLRSLDPNTPKSEMDAVSVALREYMTTPESFTTFVNIISGSENPVLRQQAAVFLLQTMSHWSNLDESLREQAKQQMTTALFGDSTRLVRHNLSVAVAVVARRELVANRWDDFLPMMHQAAQEDEVQVREAAFSVFKRLVRFFGANDPSFFSSLATLWIAGLQDASHNVRIDSFASLASMTAYFENDSDYVTFEPVFSEMVNSVVGLVREDAEEKAVFALGVLEDMLLITPNLVATLWPRLVKFNVELMECSLMEVRKRALSSIAKYVELKPLLLVKYDLVGSVLNTAFSAIVEEETDVDEGNSLPSNAQTLIDTVCLRVGPSYTFPHCMAAASECLSASADDEHILRGGLMILAMAAEGCQALMRDDIDALMEGVTPQLSSSIPMVRNAAYMVLYQFSEHFRPNIHAFHEVIIKGSLAALGEDLLSSQMHGIRALNSFIVFLDDELLVNYLDEIMEGFVGCIVADDAVSGIMCGAITGIGMLAISVKEAFAHFFEPTMELMMSIIDRSDNESLNIRARAIETIGGVAQSVGLEKFSPYLDPVMTNAFDGLKLEYCQLREHTYSFFGRLATLMGSDFTHFVDDVFPILKRVCEAPDMAVFTGDVFVDSDDDDFTENDYEVPLAAQEEKGSAACCIGVIATALGPAFMSYAMDAFTALEGLLSYDNEDVRAAVVTAVTEVAQIVPLTVPEWSFTQGLPIDEGSVPEAIREVAAYLMPKYLLRMYYEESVEVVMRAMSGLATLLRVYGPVFFEKSDNYELFSKVVSLTLQRELTCQCPLEDGDIDEAALESNADAATAGDVMSGHNGVDPLDLETPIDLSNLETDCLSEAVEAAAIALGSSLAPCFNEIVMYLADRARPQRPVYERCSALGVLSASADAMGPAIAEHLDDIILPLMLKGCEDESEDVRRNAVFGLGVTLAMMANSGVGPSLDSLLPSALKAIFAVFEAGFKEDAAAPDNAVAALARIISSVPHNAIPLSDLVPAMVQNMPLTADLGENPIVYTALFELFAASNEDVFATLPSLLRVFAYDLATEGALPEHIATNLGNLIASLLSNDQFGEHVASMINDLPDDEAQFLRSVASSAQTA